MFTFQGELTMEIIHPSDTHCSSPPFHTRQDCPRQPDVKYHSGEDIDVLLPALPFHRSKAQTTFKAEYFGVSEIHRGDSLVWAPSFDNGLLRLGVKLRCPHGT